MNELLTNVEKSAVVNCFLLCAREMGGDLGGFSLVDLMLDRYASWSREKCIAAAEYVSSRENLREVLRAEGIEPYALDKAGALIPDDRIPAEDAEMYPGGAAHRDVMGYNDGPADPPDPDDYDCPPDDEPERVPPPFDFVPGSTNLNDVSAQIEYVAAVKAGWGFSARPTAWLYANPDRTMVYAYNPRTDVLVGGPNKNDRFEWIRYAEGTVLVELFNGSR